MDAIGDDTLGPAEARQITSHKWFFWISGILAIVLGIFAIIMPHVATLAAEIVIGAIFFASGVVACITAFQARRASRIAAGFLLGLLSVAAGLILLFAPLSGIFALTIVLIAFFVAGGLLKLYFAWKIRPSRGWGWMTFGGLLSVALGALIWSGLPGTAFWALGLLVGIDLIFYGVTLVGLLLAARRVAGDTPGGASRTAGP